MSTLAVFRNFFLTYFRFLSDVIWSVFVKLTILIAFTISLETVVVSSFTAFARQLSQSSNNNKSPRLLLEVASLLQRKCWLKCFTKLNGMSFRLLSSMPQDYDQRFSLVYEISPVNMIRPSKHALNTGACLAETALFWLNLSMEKVKLASSGQWNDLNRWAKPFLWLRHKLLETMKSSFNQFNCIFYPQITNWNIWLS